MPHDDMKLKVLLFMERSCLLVVGLVYLASPHASLILPVMAIGWLLVRSPEIAGIHPLTPWICCALICLLVI